MRCRLALLVLLLCAGCSEYGYRYQPHPQVLYSPIFADYAEQDHTVDILVDTDGLRLNQLSILKADGSTVEPTAIDYPKFKPEIVQGVQEEIYGPDLADGPTVAHFEKDAIGPKPWHVRVDIQTLPPETIPVGGLHRGD